MKQLIRAGALLAICFAVTPRIHASDVFMKPTPQELAMTSLPGYPGAPAVVLFDEEITRDDLHVVQHYERIKILTEEGKQYANVALSFASSRDYGDYEGDDKMVGDIVARTIHADGTVIPFTGKPYLKVLANVSQGKYQQKVFTLPDVEVGSIIEYRYATRYNDNAYEAADWYIQGELYVKAAHFAWYPTTKDLIDEEDNAPINAISWFPILPAGVQIVHHELPGSTIGEEPAQLYELNIKDVPPSPKEEYMPPLGSFGYRVLFAFTPYRTSAEYWKSKGKTWSKHVNNFAGPNSDLIAATQAVIAGATTGDAKLRKIYAAVMALENTDFTREHERNEDKAAGLGKVNYAADVLTHKRGTPTQLTELFVGMARAAGMKAYAMLVPDRSERLFAAGWLNIDQFDAVVAVVNVDGKEVYFDPGSRYCAYGHLAWEHTFMSGLRQTADGTDFGQTPGDSYSTNRTTRVANLAMDDQGGVTGKITLTFTGSPALNWRQDGLRGDEESVKRGLREDLEHMVPKSLEVNVAGIENLQDYEQPLIVNYSVEGHVGTPAGKRLVLPVDIFVVQDAATFPQQKRETPVYYHYLQRVQDATRINFPKDMTIEAAPAASSFKLQQSQVFSMSVATAPTNITVRRDYANDDVIVKTPEYDALRTFYSQFEAKDQESVVLKPAAATTAEAKPAGN